MGHQDLEKAVKALLMLRADIVEREKLMEYRINEQYRLLKEDTSNFRRQVGKIIDEAGEIIDERVGKSLDSANTDYRNMIHELTGKVHRADKIVKGWYIGIGSILLVAAIVLFVVARYITVDLAEKREQIQNYERVEELARAYKNSDAYVCGNYLCVNAGKNIGNGYRQVKARR